MKRHASNTQTPRVNILKKIKVDGAWKLMPAVLEPNGRLKDKVRIGGSIEIHSEGTYYIEWWEGPKRKREAIPDRARVPDLANRKALALAAARAGLEVGSDALNRGEKVTQGIPLDVTIQHYLDDIKPPQREPKTYTAYKYALNAFRKGCAKSSIEHIVRADLLQFIRGQYESGCSARTAYNRANIVVQFLKLNGVKGLLHKRDWPEYVDAIRKIYEADELKTLFAACLEHERARYLFFLLTGERDREVRFTAWRDIDFRRGTVRVTAKPQLGFKPKNKEERDPSAIRIAGGVERLQEPPAWTESLQSGVSHRGRATGQEFRKQAEKHRQAGRPKLRTL